MNVKDCKVGQIVQYNFRDKLEVIKVEDNTGMVRIMNLMTGDPSTIDARYLEEIKEMENYICVNGKKIELTPEQLRQLGIEIPKTKEELEKEWFHQTHLGVVLYKKLRDFAFENGSVDIDWHNIDQWKYHLVYDHYKERWIICNNRWLQTLSTIYFTTKEIAEHAITEIIEPFMKEHPDFKL